MSVSAFCTFPSIVGSTVPDLNVEKNKDSIHMVNKYMNGVQYH